MRLLLDTGIFLRAFTDPELLSKEVRAAIDGAEERVLSAVSSWEIAIKRSIGKLPVPTPTAEYVRARMLQMRLTALSVTHAHAAAVESLPFHHRDPFDRLLIAQAILEGLTIVTTDRVFAKYGVRTIGVSVSPAPPRTKSKRKKSRPGPPTRAIR